MKCVLMLFLKSWIWNLSNGGIIMKFTGITISGIDDDVDIKWLKSLEKEDFSRFVEFGVLLSDDNNKPRYPSLKYLIDLKDANFRRLKFSGHYCGNLCTFLIINEEFFSSHYEVSNFLHGEPIGKLFNRIQLNNVLFSSLINTNNHPVSRLNKFMEKNSSGFKPTVIIQVSNDEIAEWHKYLNNNFQYIFDKSRGTGKQIEEFPLPYTNKYCGYAGGINLDNIEDILSKLKKINKISNNDSCALNRYWIDLESGVRTNDKFDEQKFYDIIKIANKFMEI